MRFNTLMAASVLGALAVLSAPAFAQTERQIVVVGEGSVSTAPDMAVVNIGVSREARKAGDALSEASAAMDTVLARISGAGIEPRDVQTTNVSLSPLWQHNNDGSAPRVTGYVATNDLSVRVRDLDALGGLLDAVVGDGANALNGISFAVADPRPLEDQARIEAVHDAITKAGLLASAAKITLGPIQSISEAGAAPPEQPMFRGAMMEAAAVPVAAGEIDIHQSVTIVFGIAD